MSKKLTKLSRRKADNKTVKQLNNSDEDFQSIVTGEKPSILEKPQSTQLSIHSEDKSLTPLDCSEVPQVNAFPPCPFCGKLFNKAQELTRISHLKSCGNQLGVNTNQLLEIKRLEERQAEEWKALNLPKTTNVTKNSTTNTSKTLKAKRAQFQATNDPHLEMALAISASLAHDAQVEHEVTTEPNKTKCWLPQAPPSKPINSRNAKSKAKTALQVRTDEDRTKQIAEAVVTILSACPENDLEGDDYVKLPSALLSKCIDCDWWSASSSQAPRVPLILDFIKPYIEKERKCRKVQKACEDLPPPVQKDTLEGDENIAPFWLKLLNTGEKSDLTIYTRDEEKLQAHSLVLFARCKSLLDDVILQGTESFLSIPEVSKNVMTSFLRYLYSGRVYLVLDSDQDLQDAFYLSEKFPKLVHWRNSIRNQDLRGFIEEDEDVEASDHGDKINLEASQNLSNLLEILEEHAEDDTQDEKSLEEWDEMCQILSQKPHQSGDKSHLDEDTKDVLESHETEAKKEEPFKDQSQMDGYESPDLFEDEDEAEESVKENLADNHSIIAKKRKSSIGCDANVSKKSKLDLDDSVAWQNCSVYSRKVDSSPSILQNDVDILDSQKDLDDIHASPDDNFKKAMDSSDHQSPSFEELEPIIEPFRTPSFLQSPAVSGPSSGVTLPPRSETVTPMPDYESMISPALRRELRRFGLKLIPRAKAVPLLNHIYEETHPGVRRRVAFEPEENLEESETSLSQESNASTTNDLAEETLDNDAGDQISHDEDEDLHDKLMRFIKANPDLHRQVLMYEPLWLEDLIEDFKQNVSGIPSKMKANHIQEILDSECITFRTRSQHDKNTKRNAKAKRNK